MILTSVRYDLPSLEQLTSNLLKSFSFSPYHNIYYCQGIRWLDGFAKNDSLLNNWCLIADGDGVEEGSRLPVADDRLSEQQMNDIGGRQIVSQRDNMWHPSGIVGRTTRVKYHVWRFLAHGLTCSNEHRRLRGWRTCRVSSWWLRNPRSEDQWYFVTSKTLVGQQRPKNSLWKEQGFDGHRQEIFSVSDDYSWRTRSRACRSRLPQPFNVELTWFSSCPTLVDPGQLREDWWQVIL